MAKPKAPRWLREAFRDGVDEFAAAEGKLPERDYARDGCQEQACYLAPFDRHRRPCSGPFERFHFANRQRVEEAMFALLREALVANTRWWILDHDRRDLILLAAWDARNGAIACEGHHRPFDSHSGTRGLVLGAADLPPRVPEFLYDYGLDVTSANVFGVPTLEAIERGDVPALDARPVLT